MHENIISRKTCVVNEKSSPSAQKDRRGGLFSSKPLICKENSKRSAENCLPKIFLFKVRVHFFERKVELIIFTLAGFIQSYSDFDQCDCQRKDPCKAYYCIFAARRNAHTSSSGFIPGVMLITFYRLNQTKSDIKFKYG